MECLNKKARLRVNMGCPEGGLIADQTRARFDWDLCWARTDLTGVFDWED